MRNKLRKVMEDGCGIFRDGGTIQTTCDALAELSEQAARITLDDHGGAYNTQLSNALEITGMLEVASAWAHLNLTVEEGLRNLNTLCVMELHITENAKIQKIPTPRPQSQTLLKALGVTLPSYIPTAELRVATKK